MFQWKSPIVDNSSIKFLKKVGLYDHLDNPRVSSNCLNEIIGDKEGLFKHQYATAYEIVFNSNTYSPRISMDDYTSRTGLEILVRQTDTSQIPIDLQYPSQDSGEKEGIQLAESLSSGFITDDLRAQDEAVRRGIDVADSVDVIVYCVRKKKISLWRGRECYKYLKKGWNPRPEKVKTRSIKKQKILNKFGFIAYYLIYPNFN